MKNFNSTTPKRIRFGGGAAVLAGLSYGAAGYLDRPNVSGYTSVLVSILTVATPTLFLVGLLGLHSRLLLRSGRNFTSGAGVLLGGLGAMLGIVDAVGLAQAFLVPVSVENWWWVPLLAGLTLIGLSALLNGIEFLGASVLASSALGWVSLLTDPAFHGVLVPMRQIHVSFAALFCISAIVWGGELLLGTPGPAQQ